MVIRWLRPPRRLRPTRAGWSFFLLTFGVAFAALNTGNNLLYLMLSLMLAFLTLSGVLSEAALRGIRVRRRLPREIVAGETARVRVEIENTQRRVPAFAIALEDRVYDPGHEMPERPAGRVFVLRLGPREECVGSYRFQAPHRGEARFTRFRVSTRFPFGLFQKSLTLESPEHALVYPGLDVTAGSPERRDARDPGDSHAGRSPAGAEVGGLREYADGDSARRVLWRASLRRGSLVVRDTERRSDAELELRLSTRGRRAGPTFERAVARVAYQVVAALEAGWRVGLRTDAIRLEPASGDAQRARLLSFLARVGPEPAKVDGQT